MRSLENQKTLNTYSKESFADKILDFIEYMVGTTYIAFSRKTMLKKLKMDPSFEGHKLIKVLYDLEKGNFIKRLNKNEYKLTLKGIKRIDFQKFYRFNFENKKKDGFWRLVIFDIPEKQKTKRELLRQKLKEFDFYMIQKSVFVSPYKCEKEIQVLCNILGLDNEVCVIVAKDLGRINKEVKSLFV